MNHFQVLVIGSGFAGSIVALVLKQLGYSVVVVDRAHHPRFAIGESSTPIADRILEGLAADYELPELLPLSSYGEAQKHSNQFTVGPKRGFSYFFHSPDQPFASGKAFANEMVVAASTSLPLSDTHWHRASTDRYLASCVRNKKITFFEGTTIESIEHDSMSLWTICLGDKSHTWFTADFVVDATGKQSPLFRAGITTEAGTKFRTRSGAVFAHFENVAPFCRAYENQATQESASSPSHPLQVMANRHPFPLDQAAVHQVTPDGWMWQLRFDSEVTSLGWCLDTEVIEAAIASGTEAWWLERLERYPTLAGQMKDAKKALATPELKAVTRLQFQRQVAAGRNWALLPSSAGFVDPLHSTGIAHSLSGVEKLGRLFRAASPRLPSPEVLQEYGSQVLQEVQWIDQLVSLCYEALPSFEDFCLASMWYFSATIHHENRRSNNRHKAGLFLSADVSDLRNGVENWRDLQADRSTLPESKPGGDVTTQTQRNRLSKAIRRYNAAGLLDPERHPFYQHTAAPGK